MKVQVVLAAMLLSGTMATTASAQDYYLPYGAPVSLITRTELNTKDNRAGDRFYLEVAEPVRARGQVIIPAGAIAVGEVVRSERNGHFGKSGKIDTRILYIDTNERRFALTGQSNRTGKGGTVGTVAAVLVFGVFGGLVHGTSGYVKAGTPVMAYTGEDIQFTMRDADASSRGQAVAIRADAAGVSPSMYNFAAN